MRPGQAASTHVLGLYRAFLDLGWTGPLLAADVAEVRRPWRKLLRYAWILLRAYGAMRVADLLYVRSHPVALLLLLRRRHHRPCVVLEVNGTVADLGRLHPATRLVARQLASAERILLRRVDGIVAVSQQLAGWSASVAAGVPVVVVHNAADPMVFHPDAVTGVPLPPRYVAFCGALAPWQGIDVVLSATRSPSWPQEVSVVIAGDGRLAPTVANEACRNLLVEFIGVVPQSDVAGVLAGSLAGLSPNTRRDHVGDAMKLYEALNSGVPVVASDVDGQREFIAREGVGLVYAADDPHALATVVRQLAEDDDLRERLARRAVAVGCGHTWPKRASQIETFLDEFRLRGRSL